MALFGAARCQTFGKVQLRIQPCVPYSRFSLLALTPAPTLSVAYSNDLAA